MFIEPLVNAKPGVSSWGQRHEEGSRCYLRGLFGCKEQKPKLHTRWRKASLAPMSKAWEGKSQGWPQPAIQLPPGFFLSTLYLPASSAQNGLSSPGWRHSCKQPSGSQLKLNHWRWLSLCVRDHLGHSLSQLGRMCKKMAAPMSTMWLELEEQTYPKAGAWRCEPTPNTSLFVTL